MAQKKKFYAIIIKGDDIVTLVIMAAGMGSRFGGLKQIEPVGPNGEFIIDYSIYDAKRAGFDKVVFIIKKENEDIFKSTIGSRVDKYIDVSYVFQTNDNITIAIPEERTKPLGTAHAILCCKDEVNESFAIINADDFYGYDAFRVMADFLKNNENESIYSLVGYKAINTLTENGAVKRGVCDIKDGCLQTITESSIEKIEGKLYATPLGTTDTNIIAPNTLVSMNMIGFNTNIFSYLETELDNFLKTADLCKDEYLIPTVITKLIKEHKISVKVLDTISKWYGITYKEDKEEFTKQIKQLVLNKEYPNQLWK